MFDVPGLTSDKVQRFINQMCANCQTYLEIGSFLGATSVAALHNNSLDAYFVDTWKEDVKPERDDITVPQNDKSVFINNIKKYKGDNQIKVFDCDMFNVDLSEIKKIDIMLYDANHNPDVTSRAIQYYSPVLSDIAILLFDDANFDGVVEGARDGIRRSGLSIVYDRLLLNDIEDADGWWNGLYIVLVTKPMKEKLNAIFI